MLRNVLLGVLFAATVQAADWQRVAYDDAGAADRQPHLADSACDWRFDNDGAPCGAREVRQAGGR